MSMRDELPVEPLSEAQWERVEEAVFAELDAPSASLPPTGRERGRGRWRLPVVVATGLAVATAVVIAVAVSSGGPPEARVSSSRIVTHGDATRVDLGEVTLDVAPRTTLLTTGSDAEGWNVALERGEVRATVPPRRERPAFVVHAGDVLVEVVGTVLTVARDDAAVEVDVREGVVRVQHEGRTLDLREGESWRSTPAPQAAGPTEPPEPADPVADDEPTVVAGDATERPLETDAPRRPPLTARALFERAQELEASAPERAVRLYRRAARGSDGWAANALYARGRLEIDLGRHRVGAATLRSYLTRFPDGTNAADARELLSRQDTPAEQRR